MHRIDGPGATVDNKFTDGDPVAGIQATMVTDDWANDVQEELISVLSAAGVAPVKGTQNQLLKSIRTVSVGIVGQVRNLNALLTTASAINTFTAEEIVVEAAPGGVRYCLSNFSQSVNLANTGIGGMLSGLAPASGYVAVYGAVKDDGTKGAFAIDATSITAPNIAASAPVGYTATALLAVWPTNASRQFVAGFQQDRMFTYDTVTQVLATNAIASTTTSLSISAAVPRNAKSINGFLDVSSTVVSAGQGSIFLFENSGSLSESTGVMGAVSNAFGQRGSYVLMPLTTVQTLFYRSAGPATPLFKIIISGYFI